MQSLTFDDLDDSALDQLPFGVVCLDERMKVVRMNKTESEASGIQRWRAIGREYFRDVAPGPTNRELADAIQAFTHGQGPRAVEVQEAIFERDGAHSFLFWVSHAGVASNTRHGVLAGSWKVDLVNDLLMALAAGRFRDAPAAFLDLDRLVKVAGRERE